MFEYTICMQIQPGDHLEADEYINAGYKWRTKKQSMGQYWINQASCAPSSNSIRLIAA